jgi:excisionase family DNA binding protein
MNADLEKLLSISDVMGYLHIGRTTLYRLTKSRRIGLIKVGKKLYFTQAHVEAFIRKNTSPAKK